MPTKIGAVAASRSANRAIALPGPAARGVEPDVNVTPEGVRVSLSLALPDVQVGVFTLTGLGFGLGVEIGLLSPGFAVDFNFATHENPFVLTYGPYGGGGYVAGPAGIDFVWGVGPKLEAGRFHFLAGRIGAGQAEAKLEFFVNDLKPCATAQFPINPKADASKLAIGQERDAIQHPGKESFDGEIARFLLWDRPLTDAELKGVFEGVR